MDEKHQPADSRTQAAIDDARLEARKLQILERPAPTTRRKAGAEVPGTPGWLTPAAPAKPAKPAAAKKKERRNQKSAGPTAPANDQWKRAVDDETRRQVLDE